MKHPCLFTLLCIVSSLPNCMCQADISFHRDIRPILSDKCFPCHGPDAQAREADLRLDLRDSAVADRGGYAAIVPHDEDASALVSRITSSDPQRRMPPAESNKQLNAGEIILLRGWVQAGAVYEQHWSFEPLAQRQPRADASWEGLANPIDRFVEERLKEQGLSFAPQAAPASLLRRLTLDLTGLPPTLDERRSLLSDLSRPNADPDVCYERVVDRLLASPHFGEHLAVAWLDAARYADTNGYFGDKPRQMWLWRDWVISAFNSNMPFDQFTVEQLAGDLLPEATVEQRIATGFNRNHMANNETGIIDEEFRVEYVVDRVHTTMTTWLGISAGCAQCHDHKFDPISQRDFYRLFAFFNNVPEKGLIDVDNPPPLLEVPALLQQERLSELAAESRAAGDAFEPFREQLVANITAWEGEAPNRLSQPPSQNVVAYEPFEAAVQVQATPLGTKLTFEQGIRGQSARFDATQHIETPLTGFNADGPWTMGMWLKPDGALSCPLSLIEPDGNRRGIELLFGKGLLRVHLVHQWGVSLIEVATSHAISSKQWHHVAVTYDGSQAAAGLRVFIDGLPARLDVARDSLTGTICNNEPLRIGRRDFGLGFYGLIDEARILAQTLDGRDVSDWYWGERIRGILSIPSAARSSQDAESLFEYYIERFGDPAAKAARRRMRSARDAERRLRDSIPTVLVMQEMDEPRVTRVLERGEYDQPRGAVTPGVPEAIAPWREGEPLNRLGFARWLVSADNPLAARVAVNRFWQHCFGEGLVRTVDDFGSQGEPPTHPELLDWLSTTFRDSGWDVKRLLRLIVTSRTYKQNSQFVMRDGQVFDAGNRLLARGPSVRLSAEMLRDQALAVSGLLVPKLGGPSVKPYQPAGLWEAVSYNGEESYQMDTGGDLFRRSLYTYIKRQAPPPTLLTFDGPTREKCTISRQTTNTPLQALVLLNDATFVESARALAARVLAEEAADDRRLEQLWTQVLIRQAQPGELALLRGLLVRQKARFSAEPATVRQLLSVGATAGSVDASTELAAWTILAHTLLNLDEAITKR